MGARISAAMELARVLVTGPRKLSPAQAAREAGITPGAISKSSWWRELQAKRKGLLK